MVRKTMVSKRGLNLLRRGDSEIYNEEPVVKIGKVFVVTLRRLRCSHTA